MSTAVSRNPSTQPECTQECRSPSHAYQVTCAITKGSDEEVVAYLKWLCLNYPRLSDAGGRSVLHTVASCGRWQALRWILLRHLLDVNVPDKESGWTPLHRSLFYGQLTAAKILLEAGASVTILDHDGLSPLDLVMKDLPPHLNNRAGLTEAYMWGNNQSYNLGFGIDNARANPEILEHFNQFKASVKQVEMCEFHSVFLLASGQVFTCGHGQGGRLGLTTERIALTPQPVNGLGRNPSVVMVAAALHHTVFLTESGSVLSCGNNVYQQLGHVPPPEKLLEPHLIDLRAFKGFQATGICAARYHTVLYSQNAIITFGLNAGQLGFPAFGEKRQASPRIVTAFPTRDLLFTHVAASEGATICATTNGDVFVLHEYLCRKIASKQLDLAAVKAVGGTLDPKADSCLPTGGGNELKVLLLTNCGRVYVWSSKSCPQVTRCLLSINRHIVVKDIAVSNVGLVLSTQDGEGFTGSLKLPIIKPKKTEEAVVSQASSHYRSNSKRMVESFSNWVERDECAQIKLQRLSQVHHASRVSCDVMGRNFAVLQANNKSVLYDVQQLHQSQMNANISKLLSEADLNDGIHDAVINVGSRQFFVHQYILANRCEYFQTQITTLREANCNIDFEDGCLTLECPPSIHPDILEQLLLYLYTDSCKLLTEGQSLTLPPAGSLPPDVVVSSLASVRGRKGAKGASNRSPRSASSRKKVEEPVVQSIGNNPVRLLQKAARAMGVRSLDKRLDCVEYIDDEVVLLQNLPTGKLTFDRKKFPQLSDVLIRTTKGPDFKCHKCILIAGSEYFRSMLVNGWMESSTSSSLMISIPSDILEIVIDCLYAEESAKLRACKDAELVCNVLATADQLLMARLKELCEIALADLLNLKNVTELVEFSRIYDAPQLKQSCMQYIGLNLAALLESKSLNVLSDEMLIDLTSTYRNLIPQMSYRAMTPHADGPTKEDLIMISQLYPVDLSDSDWGNDTLGCIQQQTKEKKKIKKRKVRNLSGSSAPSNDHTRKRNESSSSVASDISKQPTSNQRSSHSVSEPIACETMEADQTLLVSSPSPLSLEPESPTKLWQGTEGMESAFPDLVVDLNSPPQHSRKFFGTMPRLSQKERKKMTSVVLTDRACTSPRPIPHAVFAEREAKLAWGKVETDTVSLSEIMKTANEAAAATAPKFTPLFRGRPPVSDPVPISPATKATKFSASDVGALSLSPTRNPWKNVPATFQGESIESSTNLTNEFVELSLVSNDIKNKSRSSHFTPCFNDILKREQDQIDHIARQHSKSLSMIQIEDQAIEELLEHYGARNHPEEFITVSRIIPEYVAAPVWKVSKKTAW